MDRIRLELDFLDDIEKVFRIRIDNPDEELSGEDIKQITDVIIDNNIFTSSGNDLISIKRARKIRTSTEDIELD